MLVERVLTQPKTADVHVWNADLDGWKPPRDLPELAQEMLRRRRSLTPVPPPPPRRLFPTGNHPSTDVAARANGEARSETKAETRSEAKPAVAVSIPGTVEARGTAAPGRPNPPGTTAGHGPVPSHPSAPGTHSHHPGSSGGPASAHPPGHTGKNGASNGVQAAGFAVDHLVGGDASAAI